jgi:PAS domain S-box-containing protein
MESKQPSPFFYSSAPHCLREKKQEILARWETRARAKLASASRTNHFVLLDSLPAFLDQLSNSLEQRTPRVVEMKNVAEAHAIQRASLEDYNLEQVQSEYNILRQVIFEVLDENNMVDVRERNIILDSIADGHIAAANEYMRIAHQRVQLSEERLSLALESAQMGTFEWNIKDGSLYWSDTLIKLSGLGPDEFTGRIDDFWKQILPNDLASVQDAIRKSLENRGDYLAEFRVAWPDKTVHWILARGRTYFDKDNQPERMLGTGVDITERKALEESLKLSNKAIENDRAWLEMVLNSIPIPTFLLDAQERKIAFENESSKNLTFMIPREFTPEMSDRFYAVDSKGNLIKTEDLPRHRVARGEEVKDFEMTWHTPRGSVSLLISGKRLPAAYGHPPICVLSLRDITELKRIEAGLKESEAKFKLLYESELIGIVFGDIGGGMHEMNDYFLSLIGYTREDVIQNHVNWLQLTPPEYLHLDEKAIAEMNRTGRCTPYEKPFIRKDGSWVWIMLTAIFMDESHFKHVAIVIDITELKLELER